MSFIRDGFYTNHDLSNEAYHSDPALSKSGLAKLWFSPKHYKEMVIKETADMELGTPFHLLMLESEREKTDVIIPSASVCNKSGGWSGNVFYEWREYTEAANPRASIVKQEMYDKARRMRDSLMKKTMAQELFKSGHAEVSAFITDYDDIRKKCRPDFLCENSYDVVDLKKCTSAKDLFFGAHAARFKYHWSAAWTLHILGQLEPNRWNRYIIVATEADPPFETGFYMVSDEQVVMARAQIEPIVRQYAECLKTGVWHGYDDGLRELLIPRKYLSIPRDEDRYGADVQLEEDDIGFLTGIETKF